jgi:hypothetical protein
VRAREEELKTYVIGRSAFADIVLADESVAPRHAEVVVTDDGRLHVTDCATATGTWRRIAAPESGEAVQPPLWEPVRQAFVLADEPLRLGEHLCTLKDLLRMAAEGPLASGAQPAAPAAAGGEAAPRVRGRVERDAKTGEIIRKRP